MVSHINGGKSSIIISILSLFLTVTHVHQAKSADPVAVCGGKNFPYSNFICEDPVIGALDLRLADLLEEAAKANDPKLAAILKTSLPEWRNSVGRKCGIPKKGGIDFFALWKVAPCVFDQYRGHVNELQTLLNKDAEPVVLPNTETDLHPHCLLPFIEGINGEAPDDYPLSLCVQGTKHIPVEKSKDGRLFSSLPSWGGFWQAFLSYRNIGIFKVGPDRDVDASVLLVDQATGGSGVFSRLVMVVTSPRAPEKLYYVLSIYFGDRCNRGVDNGIVREGRTIEFERSITSFDLFTLEDDRDFRAIQFRSEFNDPDNPKKLMAKGLLELEPYEDLERYASWPCFGTATYEISLDEGEDKLLYVTVAKIRESPSETRYQQCFNELLSRRLGVLPRRLYPPEIEDLAKAFANTCMKPN